MSRTSVRSALKGFKREGMHATSANHVAYTNAGTPRGRFVTGDVLLFVVSVPHMNWIALTVVFFEDGVRVPINVSSGSVQVNYVPRIMERASMARFFKVNRENETTRKIHDLGGMFFSISCLKFR